MLSRVISTINAGVHVGGNETDFVRFRGYSGPSSVDDTPSEPSLSDESEYTTVYARYLVAKEQLRAFRRAEHGALMRKHLDQLKAINQWLVVGDQHKTRHNTAAARYLVVKEKLCEAQDAEFRDTVWEHVDLMERLEVWLEEEEELEEAEMEGASLLDSDGTGLSEDGYEEDDFDDLDVHAYEDDDEDDFDIYYYDDDEDDSSEDSYASTPSSSEAAEEGRAVTQSRGATAFFAGADSRDPIHETNDQSETDATESGSASRPLPQHAAESQAKMLSGATPPPYHADSDDDAADDELSSDDYDLSGDSDEDEISEYGDEADLSLIPSVETFKLCIIFIAAYAGVVSVGEGGVGLFKALFR